MDLFVLLGTLFLCFGIGMPISYSLGFGALVGALWIGIPPEAVMLKISDGVSKVAMLTIPFFVLAGAIMAEGGMAQRLVKLRQCDRRPSARARRTVGGQYSRHHVPQRNLRLFSCRRVGDRFGADSADGEGRLSARFRHQRDDQRLAAGHRRAAEPQFRDLLAGDRRHDLDHQSVHGRGGAGAAARLCLVMLCLFIAYRDGHPTGESVPFHGAVRITIDAAWGLITIVIIIGGILLGVFTAVEAGAVACIWAFCVTMFIYRDYRWRDLPGLVHRTLKTVAMVMTLIAMASSFGYVMALMQLPAKITTFFLSVSENKYVILMLINFMLLVLGCLMDMAPLILICTPILLPVVMKLGVDPVHFGMIMLLNLGIGLLTPPVGSVLFVGCAIGDVKMEEVMRTIWPFYAVMFAVLMLVTFIPSLSLWLPALVIK